MTDPAPKLEDERPLAHHYILVILVEVVTLAALWWLSRLYT